LFLHDAILQKRNAPNIQLLERQAMKHVVPHKSERDACGPHTRTRTGRIYISKEAAVIAEAITNDMRLNAT
jgi:hypothetical protein